MFTTQRKSGIIIRDTKGKGEMKVMKVIKKLMIILITLCISIMALTVSTNAATVSVGTSTSRVTVRKHSLRYSFF